MPKRTRREILYRKQQYQQEIEAENQLIQEMLAAEAAAKKAAEETAKDPEIAATGKKRMSIAQRAHLAENLDDAPEEEAK